MPRIYVSTVVPAPVAEVWHLLRDFDGLPRWAPFVRASRIEEGLQADQLGCVRILELTDGNTLREQLVALSDYDFSCSHAILDGTLPLRDHLATLSVAPVTDRGHSFCSWETEFICRAEDESALTGRIRDMMLVAGLDGLAASFRTG